MVTTETKFRSVDSRDAFEILMILEIWDSLQGIPGVPRTVSAASAALISGQSARFRRIAGPHRRPTFIDCRLHQRPSRFQRFFAQDLRCSSRAAHPRTSRQSTKKVAALPRCYWVSFWLNQLRARVPDCHSVFFPPKFEIFNECYRSLLSFTGFYQLWLTLTEVYLVLPGFTGLYQVWSGVHVVLARFTEFYRVLPSFTEFYWVLLGFTGFYRVLPGSTRSEAGFTWF